MRRHILLGCQLGRQFRHRDVRLGLDPLQQCTKIRGKLTAAWRTPFLQSCLCDAQARMPTLQTRRKLGLEYLLG